MATVVNCFCKADSETADLAETGEDDDECIDDAF